MDPCGSLLGISEVRGNSGSVSPDQPRPLSGWAERPGCCAQGRWLAHRPPPLWAGAAWLSHQIPEGRQFFLSCQYSSLCLPLPVAQMTTSLGATGEERQKKHRKQGWCVDSITQVSMLQHGWRAAVWPRTFSGPGAGLPGFCLFVCFCFFNFYFIGV